MANLLFHTILLHEKQPLILFQVFTFINVDKQNKKKHSIKLEK